MVATLETVWNRGHVVFGAACYMHGLLTSPDWQTLEVIFPQSNSDRHNSHPPTKVQHRVSQSTMKPDRIFVQKIQVEGVTAESVLLSWLGGERVLKHIFFFFFFFFF